MEAGRMPIKKTARKMIRPPKPDPMSESELEPQPDNNLAIVDQNQLEEQPIIRPVPLSGFNPDDNSAYLPITRQTQSFRRKGPKVQVSAYTVQCSLCMNWRVVPSKEIYESIRQSITERPWACEDALPWRPDASCSQPSDLRQDDADIWAVDKADLPMTPPGWTRDLVVRSQGCTKFGDIYYTSPCGKKLRSMVEIDRFLQEHPEYVLEGVHLGQFTFTTPQPTDKNYVQKKRKNIDRVESLTGPRPAQITYVRRNKKRSDMQNSLSLCEQVQEDRGSIPHIPDGWIRELVIRGQSYKCDVYYCSPCGRRLRSLAETNAFLHENPGYVFQGVSLDQFSFSQPSSLADLRKAASMRGCSVRSAMRGAIDAVR